MMKPIDKIDYIPITTTPSEHKKVRFKRAAKYITFDVESTINEEEVEPVQSHRRLIDRSVTVFRVFPLCDSLVELLLLKKK